MLLHNASRRGATKGCLELAPGRLRSAINIHIHIQPSAAESEPSCSQTGARCHGLQGLALEKPFPRRELIHRRCIKNFTQPCHCCLPVIETAPEDHREPGGERMLQVSHFRVRQEISISRYKSRDRAFVQPRDWYSATDPDPVSICKHVNRQR